MASEQDIFSIYRRSDDARYFVLHTIRQAFNNASQSDEDKSWAIESANRTQLLEFVGKPESGSSFEFIGELHGFPIGEVFYSDYGKQQIPVYYMHTDFGKPWIVFGTADSEEEFLQELKNDDELQALNPIGEVLKIDAYLVTQNDVNFN